jgi:hypothetical protein
MGTGLNIELYEEAVAHLCGQPLDADVDIRIGNRLLGAQRMNMSAPNAGLRITALPPRGRGAYKAQLACLLLHTDLQAIQWINVTRSEVRFTTVKKA